MVNRGVGQKVRSVPDSVVSGMQKQEVFKYANDPSFWEKEKSSGEPAFIKLITAIMQSRALRWLLFALVFFLLAFVIYRIMVVNNLFAPSRKRLKKDTDDPGENDLPENVDERIAAAIAAGEYRLAIRYYYLKTLSLLSEKNKIKLHAKSTNHDYLQQMQGRSDGREFRALTGIYEYVWYGQFQPDAMQFETISREFNQFNERI